MSKPLCIVVLMISRSRCLLALLFIVILFAGESFAGSSVSNRPLSFGGPKFKVEELSAEPLSDGKLLSVHGVIVNLELKPLKGYVIVYFKNGAHDVLHATEVKVNKNRSIAGGERGYFETTENVEGLGDLANISIEFVER